MPAGKGGGKGKEEAVESSSSSSSYEDVVVEEAPPATAARSTRVDAKVAAKSGGRKPEKEVGLSSSESNTPTPRPKPPSPSRRPPESPRRPAESSRPPAKTSRHENGTHDTAWQKPRACFLQFKPRAWGQGVCEGKERRAKLPALQHVLGQSLHSWPQLHATASTLERQLSFLVLFQPRWYPLECGGGEGPKEEGTPRAAGLGSTFC